MRRVIAGVFVSLDGVMQAPGGPEEDPMGGFSHGGWTVPFWDEASFQEVGRQFDAPFDLLLGRRTYEIFAAHWPFVEDEPEGDPVAIARRFNQATKYVATRSGGPLSWQNSVPLREAATDVAQLKREEGPNLLIQGSSVLIQSLLDAGLIDEFWLFVFPVLLGGGKRLFGDGTRAGHARTCRIEDLANRARCVPLSTCRSAQHRLVRARGADPGRVVAPRKNRAGKLGHKKLRGRQLGSRASLSTMRTCQPR